MTIIVNTKLGDHRGKKRIWLEGQKLTRNGFEPGMKLQVSLKGSKLILKAGHVGQFTVSRRERNGTITPIIDVTANELATVFDGVRMLRAVIREGSIIIEAHQEHARIKERNERLVSKLEQGTPLDVCSLFHGGGVLDKALHAGLKKAGISSKVSVAVEIEAKYLDSSLRNNPELWSQDSILIESPIENVILNRNPPPVDIVIGGIPCTGASKAGRAKNKLEFAESHDEAGAMFFHFLQFVQVLNPSIVIIENVPEYANTASMQVIRSVLASLGYGLQERVLDGNEFGALEKRKRLCAVAISEGLQGLFDLQKVTSIKQAQKCLNDILEPMPLDSDRWRSFDYLAEKQERDREAGKNFNRQLLTGEEPYCGTIGRDYSKCRSTEPFLLHPQQSNLSRIFTPVEHARIKGIPESVIEGLSDTTAHQVLGQSVVFPVFEALALHLGKGISKAVKSLQNIYQPDPGKQIPGKGSFPGFFADSGSQRPLFAA